MCSLCRDAAPPALWLPGAALLLGMGSAMSAHAQDGPRLEVEPAVLVSDNPFLLDGGDRAAAAAEVTLRPSMRWSLPPGGEAVVSGVVFARQYSRAYGNFLAGRLDGEARNRENEYLSWSAALSASRDQAIDILTTTIDAVVDPRSFRTSLGSRVSVVWNPNARTSITPTIGAVRSTFTGNAPLADTRSIDVGVALARRMDERTSLGGRAAAIFSQSGSLGSLSVQTLTATIDHRLESEWRLTADVGLERSGVGTIVVGGVATSPDNRVRLNGEVQFCRDRTRDTFCLSGALRSEVSGLGGLQRQLLLRGTARTQASARDTIQGSVEYRKSTMWDAVAGDVDAVRAQVALDRRLRRSLFLRPSLEYLARQLLTGRRIGAGYAQLSLLYRWEPE